MASQPLRARVEKAFPAGEVDDFALFYLGTILDARSTFESSVRRTGLLIVAVLVAIELLLSENIEEVSLLGTKITEASATRALAPAVLAYLSYEIVQLMTVAVAWGKLRDELVRRVRPAVQETELHLALRQGVVGLWGGPTWHLEGEPGVVGRIREGIDVGLGGVLSLGIWVYAGTVYARLFDAEGGAAVVWLSTGFAALMLLRTLLLLLDEARPKASAAPA
ncbi:MAG TPA: hypothetical protein VHF89_00320 [Solirubrobacteraceae bacterium]|nr:hypothetical protein [Solirubrobacteraceae bacterium]